jgi:hypothetical protein
MAPLTDESKKILPFANIGVWTATLLFGTWNLLHCPATTSQLPRTRWNVGTAPLGAGHSFRNVYRLASTLTYL